MCYIVLMNKKNFKLKKVTHLKLLMSDINALNVNHINIFQVLKFMYKPKCNLNSRVFADTFTKIHHRHPTRFCRSNLNKWFFVQLLYLMCFFRIGIFECRCAFKWLYVCMYISCMYMFVYIGVYVFIHTYM